MNWQRWRTPLLGIGLLIALDAAALALVLELGFREDPAPDLCFSQAAEVATLDPHKMRAVNDGRIAGALFEGLVVDDPPRPQPRPGVAERWTISPDGKVYTFYLRGDARWSDGSPVTAEDFVYSWRRALDVRTASPYNYMLFPIAGAERYVAATEAREALKESNPQEAAHAASEAAAGLGVVAVSPCELRVTLQQPTAYFLELAAFDTYLPVKRSCVERPGPAGPVEVEGWTKADRIIGNGPYVLKKWQYKHVMRLEKNPHYWNRDRVRLASVEVYPIEDANTVFIRYERGELDFITEVPPLAVERLIELKRSGARPDFHCFPYLATYYYRFNCTRAPLTDVRVRKALALAFDKQEVVQNVGRAGQLVAGALVPPGMPNYRGPEGLKRDPALARRLLAEAGFPGGKGFPKLTLLYNTSESHKSIAALAQVAWRRELGIEVDLNNLEWKVFLERVKNLDYDIARAGWIGDYVDPNTFLDMFVTGGGNNDTGWSSAEYDRLIAAAAGELDAAQRMEHFRRAEKILVEDSLPIVPIYFYVNSALCRPRVKGFQPNLRNHILFQDLWLEKAERRP